MPRSWDALCRSKRQQLVKSSMSRDKCWHVLDAESGGYRSHAAREQADWRQFESCAYVGTATGSTILWPWGKRVGDGQVHYFMKSAIGEDILGIFLNYTTLELHF
jgi:hypothetical protein